MKALLAILTLLSAALSFAAETNACTKITLEREYDFELLENPGRSWKNVTDTIGEKYPGLEGTYLYLPTNSHGVLQISNGENRGTLVIPGFDDFSEMEMRLTARCHSHPEEADSLTVGWIPEGGGATNTLAKLTVEPGFTTQAVSLSNAPQGASIILNHGGKKTHHRIIVDSIAFLKIHTPKLGFYLKIR